jgi:hypothetical protein
MKWCVKRFLSYNIGCGAYSLIDDVSMMSIFEECARRYEGALQLQRIGVNFPKAFFSREAVDILTKNMENTDIHYLILYPEGDVATFQHEWRHVLFFFSEEVRQSAEREWYKLNDKERSRVEVWMTRMRYPREKWLDEFQAYAHTEKRKLW